MVAPSPELVMVAAIARNGVIGNGNTLPWHVPSDLKHFKSLTMGHPIIMGRKTFDSIGRPLPGRKTIVLTHDRSFSVMDIVVVHTLDEAVDAAAREAAKMQVTACMVVGGAQLYSAFMPQAARLELTWIEIEPDGDAFFPPIRGEEWLETTRLPQPRSPKDEADFIFVTLRRRIALQGAPASPI